MIMIFTTGIAKLVVEDGDVIVAMLLMSVVVQEGKREKRVQHDW